MRRHSVNTPGLRGMTLAAALCVLLAAAGCQSSTPTGDTTVSADLQYVLDKLNVGSREERGDALALLVADPALYPIVEPRLRDLVTRENDLFLRERLIDGLGVMATKRLWGAAQAGQYGIPRQALPTGYMAPPPPPEDDPTVGILERLVHETNPYIVAHARAARARVGVRRGLWGLILALEEREVYPEMADLSLQLLREVTGLHLTSDPAEWWALLNRTQAGEQYVDPQFTQRSQTRSGL